MARKSPPLTLVKPGTGRAQQPTRPLGRTGRTLWDQVMREYDLRDVGGRELLLLACESLDRAESLRNAIARDGEMIRSKSGMRENPLLKVELQCRAFVARTLVRLGLNISDASPLRDGPGRPGHGGLGIELPDDA